MSAEAAARAAGLPCWSGRVELEPLGGGITNTNFVARLHGERYVVRIGNDIPVHGVMRFNEQAASRAAHAAGISPEVVYAEAGAMVLRFVDGKTFAEEDVRDDGNLRRILPLIRRCHFEIPKHFRGPGLMFWVFQIIRDYGATLRQGNHRLKREVPRLVALAEELEERVGPIRVIFGHNDLLAANFIDDGDRLWLVDWDYAGYNSGLFDLGGLASNSRLSTDQERWLVETYFEAPVSDDLWCRYNAMKCASLLREAMWSMVSEIHSSLDFDYVAYTAENMARFERAYAGLKEL